MSESFKVPKKSGNLHKEKLKRKNCAFPGCKKTFMGTGKSKFCEEHRKRKYRKFIDAERNLHKKKENNFSPNPNLILNHNFSEQTTLVMTCACEGCANEFSIVVYPKTTVYPKYCEKHRNPYKRQLFIDSQRVNSDE